MAKDKRGTKANPVTQDQLKEIADKIADKNQFGFKIMQATIKDDFCNYGYEITKGIGIGDKHKVEGTGIIKDELREAFVAFNAHLAVIDEVYKHSGIEVTDIDLLHNEELTLLYRVNSFVIKGETENETIVLTGIKYVSTAGGRMEIKTPAIPLDNLSSYKWYNELKAAAEIARNEVARYTMGNYIAVTEDAPKKSPFKQLSITDQNSEDPGNENPDSEDDSMDDFNNNKV